MEAMLRISWDGSSARMKTAGLPTESVLSPDAIVGVLMNFNLCSFCVVLVFRMGMEGTSSSRLCYQKAQATNALN